MTDDSQYIVNQWLRDFTVEVLMPDDSTAGTGVAVSPDGKIVTCAHVVRAALGVEPRDAGDQTVALYFPQARRDADKQRKARVAGCFREHDDDVVVLQIVDGLMPLAPEQIAVIGKCEGSDGHEFSTYGYRFADKVPEPLYGNGQVMAVLDVPRGRQRHSGRVQLKTSDVNAGMSGAAVLDNQRNLVVGIISSKYFTESPPDRDLAFAVNARVLSLDGLNIPLWREETYPRKAGQTPKLTDEQEQQVKSAPTPAPADLSRAPNVLPEWVGRADLLATLHADYRDPSARVIGLVGYGGEGKTSLARKFLDELLNAPDRPSAAFWWSFYEDRSADSFFEAAVTYFGGADMARSATSASARAGYLAALLRDQRALIVLDGFEVMQHEDGDQYGAIQSEALRDFLRMAATVGGDSLCVVTSRAPLIDLVAYTTFRQHDVTRLSAADGRDLLRAVGVKGNDAALSRIVERWDGHALTLSLIGGVLRDLHGGDAAQIDAVPAPTADESRYERVKRVLRRYDEHLSESERAFLLIFSAFRRPVRADAFGKVFRRKENLAWLNSLLGRTSSNRLNAPLTTLSESAFAKLVSGLEQKRLIRLVTENDGADAYTEHPLVRAHYSDLLTARADAQVAHRQIADYYQAGAPKSMPRLPTLDDLAPYIEIVHHLCAAGAYDEAWQVQWERLYQRERYLIYHIFGAYETNLAISIHFFPKGDLARFPAVIETHAQSIILTNIGLCLMNLGRGRAAVPFYERSNDLDAKLGDPRNASIGYQNLAELYASLGDLPASVTAARRALALTEQVENKRDRRAVARDSRAYLAWALHLGGDLTGAADEFARAEVLEFADQGIAYLYSLRGVQQVDHLQRAGNLAYARRVTGANTKLCEEYGWQAPLSQCHRILGDLDVAEGKPDSARAHYDQAVSIARKIDKRDVWIGALLGRGRWYAKHMGDAPAAFNDLNEALGYALSGEYRIYEADIRVALAWAHKANGDPAQARVEAERAKADSIRMGYHWGKVDADEVLAALGDGN